jgi:transposase-like protein
MRKVKKYDENYKNQLCEMMIVGGKTPTEVHKIMGVSIPTLTKWRKRYLLSMGSIESDGKLKSAIEVDADNRALRDTGVSPTPNTKLDIRDTGVSPTPNTKLDIE